MKAEKPTTRPVTGGAPAPAGESMRRDCADVAPHAGDFQSEFLVQLAHSLEVDEKVVLDVLAAWLADYEAGPRAIEMRDRNARGARSLPVQAPASSNDCPDAPETPPPRWQRRASTETIADSAPEDEGTPGSASREKDVRNAS